MRRLVILSGRAKGQQFDLTQPTISIGRADENNLVLDDDDVSRRHVLLTFDGIEYKLRDLGSRNGSKVNGKPILESKLVPGDRLHIGMVEARYETVGEKIPVPPPGLAPAPVDTAPLKALEEKVAQLTAQNRQLDAQVATAQKDLAAAQQQAVAAQQSVAEVEKRAAATTSAEVSRLTTELTKARTDAEQAQQSLTQAQAVVVEKQALQQQLEAAKSQLAGAQQSAAEAEKRSTATASAEVARLTTELATARTHAEQAKALVAEKLAVEQQLETAKTQLTAAQQLVVETEKRSAAAAGAEVARISAELAEARAEAERAKALQQQLEATKSELAAVQQRSAATASAEVTRLTSELVKVRTDVEQTLAKEQESLQKQMATLQAQAAEERRHAAERETTTRQRLEGEVAGVRTELQRATTELTTTRQELDQVKQQATRAEQLGTRNRELESQLGEVKQQFTTAQQQLASAVDQLATTRLRVSEEQQRTTEKTTGEATRLNAELEKLRADLAVARQAAARVDELTKERATLAAQLVSGEQQIINARDQAQREAAAAEQLRQELAQTRGDMELAKKETAKIVVSPRVLGGPASVGPAKPKPAELGKLRTQENRPAAPVVPAVPKIETPVPIVDPAALKQRITEQITTMELRVAQLEKLPGGADNLELKDLKHRILLARSELYRTGMKSVAPAASGESPKPLAEAPAPRRSGKLPWMVVGVIVIPALVVWGYLTWSGTKETTPPVPAVKSSPAPATPSTVIMEPPLVTPARELSQSVAQAAATPWGTEYRDPHGRFVCRIPPGWQAEETGSADESKIRFFSGRDSLYVISHGSSWPSLDRGQQGTVERDLFMRMRILNPDGLYGNLLSSLWRTMEGAPALQMETNVTLKDEVTAVMALVYHKDGRSHAIELHIRSHERYSELAVVWAQFLGYFHSRGEGAAGAP